VKGSICSEVKEETEDWLDVEPEEPE
jgi:hypothetical protein